MQVFYLVALYLCFLFLPLRAEVLPTWQDGENRQKIIDYVTAISDAEGADFIPQEERIAVFDNDGTLWSEYPVYTQIFFAMDRLIKLAQHDQEIANSAVAKALREKNFELFVQDQKALSCLIEKTHVGMPVDEFRALAAAWIQSNQHPAKKKPFSKLTFKPMIELMDYLRDHGFQVYIVSGGGVHFIRSISEALYRVPPEKVIGSMLGLEYQHFDGRPQVLRVAGVHSYDDHEGKVLNITRNIGRQPIFAAGNSDGDFEMLEWTTSNNKYRSFALLVHHTDGVREFAYDRESITGKLVRGLDEYESRGWTLVDMKKDWKQVYSD